MPQRAGRGLRYGVERELHVIGYDVVLCWMHGPGHFVVAPTTRAGIARNPELIAGTCPNPQRGVNSFGLVIKGIFQVSRYIRHVVNVVCDDHRSGHFKKAPLL